MDYFLFADQNLALRLEMIHAWRCVHYAEAQKKLKPQSNSTVERVAGGFAIFADQDSPVNRTIGLGMHHPVDKADIEFIGDFYRKRNSMSRVDVCPLADPSLLTELQREGYRLEGFQSVLAYVLPAEPIKQPASPKVQVRPVSLEEAPLWIRVTAQGFSEQENPTQETLDILAPNFYADKATCFMAWIDGEPVGGGAMYLHETGVELGGTSTRPAYRRRGVHTALVDRRLAVAQAASCDLVTTLTSPGSDSQRNMENMGFFLAYTKAILIGPEHFLE